MLTSDWLTGVCETGDGGCVHSSSSGPAHCPWSHHLHREQVQDQRQQHQVPLPQEQGWHRGQD